MPSPLARMAPPPLQHEALRPALRKIFLVGDNALLASDTAMQLRRAGYAVVTATRRDQLAPLLARPGPMTCCALPTWRSTRQNMAAVTGSRWRWRKADKAAKVSRQHEMQRAPAGAR